MKYSNDYRRSVWNKSNSAVFAGGITKFFAALALGGSALVAPATADSGGVILLSHWTVEMPFEASKVKPKRVGRVTDTMWPWLKEDMRLLSVNGMKIPHVAAIPAALRMSTEPEEKTHLYVKIGIGKDENGKLIEEMMLLPVTQDSVLGNGMMFETKYEGSAWVTRLKKVPLEFSDAFFPGDRLISYSPTGELINSRTSLRDIFQRERRAGKVTFPVKLERAGNVFESTINMVDPEATEAPAQTPLAKAAAGTSEDFVVTSDWSVRLPFAPSITDPSIIGDVKDEMWPWVKSGLKVRSINGVDVADINALPAALRTVADPEDKMHLLVKVAVDTVDGNAPFDEMMVLPITQNTVLANGMHFETICINEVWTTTLVKLPQGDTSGLKVGDRVVSYTPTGETFDTRQSLPKLLKREGAKGMSAFEIVITRDGEEQKKTINF